MPAYIIADLVIRDAAAMQPYIPAVPPIVRKHGGEYLVRGGKSEPAEGDWHPGMLVVIKFPDMTSARAFLDDPEYAPWKELRQRSGHTNGIIVEGI
jgi:uncharacterized protein (DUF1330 family)